MALIIAATDFTEVGDNSVTYACQLAHGHGARVFIVHTFIMPVLFSDVPMPASMLNDEQKDAEERIESLVASLSAKYDGLSVKGRVIYGDTIEILDEIREESKDLWMVVLGNSSLAQIDIWPDNVLLDAIKRLKFPVLAVPQDVTFRNVTRICLAVDNNPAGYANAIARMRSIDLLLHAEWHVLHVSAPNETGVFPSAEMRSLIEDLNPEYHSVDLVHGTDDTILSFIQEHEFDWLVMMPRKHSFFEAILHKSHTRALARSCRIPILAIHESIK